MEWGEEQSQALRELKNYLSIAPILSASKEEEDLFLYLAVLEVAVSVLSLKEEDGNQKLVFYISKMLLDTKKRYSTMEKVVLALETAKKKTLALLRVSYYHGKDQLSHSKNIVKTRPFGETH